MKRSAAKIDLTDDTNEFIIEDFISNPQRAKRCNISVFTAEINKMQLDKDIFWTSMVDTNTILYQVFFLLFKIDK